MKKYYFYMQPTTKDGLATEAAWNLEDSFPGLKYSECKGLEDVGEPKNIYTEDYAEKSGPRVYHPSDRGAALTRKETTVRLSLLFVGEDRQASYDAFVAFASASRLFYWDSARFRKVWLVLAKGVEPDKDYLGDGGCIFAEFEFTNLWGASLTCDIYGDIVP